MSFLRMPFVRIGVTVALIGLLCLSVLMIKNVVTVGWQNLQREDALYRKSPNCMATTDPVLVDHNLPPCQDFNAAIVAKPQETVVYHGRISNHVVTHRRLTLRFDNGQMRTVGNIYEDMWNSIAIGNQVSVKYWHGQVREVNANGYHCSVDQPVKYGKSATALAVWMVIGFVYSFCLSFMWRKPRAQSGWLAPFG